MGNNTSYNEVYKKPGQPRELYKPLIEIVRGIGSGEFSKRESAARECLRKLGATFPLPGSQGEQERVLPADWTPRIIPKDHWQKISSGILQRGKAINAWLADLYNGDQSVVPREIVESSVFYRDSPLPESCVDVPVHVYGPDLVHLGDGDYVVLEDNVRVPSGVGYSEALRKAGREIMGDLFEPYDVCKIGGYFDMICATMEAAAPPGVENPCIAVVTRGEGDSAYFEHSRIAEACGFRLLTLGDCYVEDGEVRDLSDGQRIDVMYRRFDEDYIETDLPELEDVYMSGKVSFANALGVGVADDKAVFPYIPAMIEHYLAEEPILNNAPTYSLVESEGGGETLDRLEELVLKPREGSGGQGLLVGPESSAEEVEDARQNAKEDPVNFIAQETLDFSTHVLDEGRDGNIELAEAYIDLRAFVLPAVGYVMPGGLTRVANPGTRVVNSSAGGRIKDTWVLNA
ncbi:MAG: circularly permuted type 2 ATP-grasp protein [Rubrobacteraceae bacterium]